MAPTRRILLRVGVFQMIRIATSCFVERQFGFELFHRTAPPESAFAKDTVPACPVFHGSCLGALGERGGIIDAAHLKDPHTEPRLIVYLFMLRDTSQFSRKGYSGFHRLSSV